jgi:hypothetical protein
LQRDGTQKNPAILLSDIFTVLTIFERKYIAGEPSKRAKICTDYLLNSQKCHKLFMEIP